MQLKVQPKLAPGPGTCPDCGSVMFTLPATLQPLCANRSLAALLMLMLLLVNQLACSYKLLHCGHVVSQDVLTVAAGLKMHMLVHVETSKIYLHV